MKFMAARKCDDGRRLRRLESQAGARSSVAIKPVRRWVPGLSRALFLSRAACFTGPGRPAHLAFYDHTCVRVFRPLPLVPPSIPSIHPLHPVLPPETTPAHSHVVDDAKSNDGILRFPRTARGEAEVEGGGAVAYLEIRKRRCPGIHFRCTFSKVFKIWHIFTLKISTFFHLQREGDRRKGPGAASQHDRYRPTGSKSVFGIGIGDGGRGHLPSPKKQSGKIFFGQMIIFIHQSQW